VTALKDGLTRTIAYFEKLIEDDKVREALRQEFAR
jgi:hypothetical protein